MDIPRREMLLGSAAICLPSCLPGLAFGQDSAPVHAIVDALVDTAQQHRSNGRPVPVNWYADRIRGFGLSPAQERAAVFHLIQRIPYQVSRWTGDPDGLFFGWRGDCRHKAAALRRMFAHLGTESRHVIVRFDWADLPIPDHILAELPQTQSIHDTVAINIADQWVHIDATWDPSLTGIGFPATQEWDGISPTLRITNANIAWAFLDEIPAGESPYVHLNVPWPEMARTQAFNRRLNPWLIQQRSLVAQKRSAL